MYEIIYDVDEEVRNIREVFHGDWFDVQDKVQDLKNHDCYNIAVNYIGGEEDEECDDW